jgi:N6-L-threonylcarbamoyladenine synthase
MNLLRPYMFSFKERSAGIHKNQNFTYVLGIETSCDETSAAVVKDGREVLSSVISSQIDLHAVFGGVVPEIAARKHIETIGPIADEALKQAGLGLKEIDGFAVANGPGLAGALLVGVSYIKALAYALKRPLAGIHHIEGHVCANYLHSAWEPPFLCLVVSGGHTSLLAVRDYDAYEVLGRTRDDAAGEAFDKTARVLGLGYPGGPAIDSLARTGNPEAVRFTRPSLGENSLDFSFSGLKTAVVQYMSKPDSAAIADVAASFQQAVIDVLVGHTMEAAKRHGFDRVALAGGVAANRGLREAMEQACEKNRLSLHMPEIIFCTDNAAMVAARGYYALQAGRADGYDLDIFSR